MINDFSNVAYEFEGAALRDVFPERHSECAVKLADRLEEHWARATPPRCDMDTAALLALRIAHLRHLALEQAPAESKKSLAEGVVKAYDRVDLDGQAPPRKPAPEEVFDPINPIAVENQVSSSPLRLLFRELTETAAPSVFSTGEIPNLTKAVLIVLWWLGIMRFTDPFCS